jgi:hypothetical protein
MFKDLAILLGLPAAVYFLTKLTGRPRAAMVAGGITLAGLLAIAVPNFLAARERIEAVRGSFLAFREDVAANSPEAMQWLVASEQQALEEAANGLGGRVRARDLFESIAPRGLPHEEITVKLMGKDEALVHIVWQGRGTIGFIEGEKVEEFRSVREDGVWKFALGPNRLRAAVKSFARQQE